MEIDEFVLKIKEHLPFEAGLENDRIGIQINSGKKKINKVLVTYEITKEVTEEINEKKVELIVSFHPLIYHPTTQITVEERVGEICIELIKNSVSLVVCHTNFDAYKYGTSFLFGEAIGLKEMEFIERHKTLPDFGFGVFGTFETPIFQQDLLKLVQSVTNSPIKWTEGRTENIKKIAILGGSGINFAAKAYESGADAFITADISYHNFHKYKGKMMLIDPGHWEMEYLVPFSLARLLRKIFEDQIIFYVSKTYTNPIKYYPYQYLNQEQVKKMLNIEE
ncbi:MAG: Nif3-like dinuclear metal center hexameric protein [Ignavibacteria bacterium]|nr:Nif3-like dinuclear metal center hexameric protein [Ignavibacteria bacterium]